MWRSVPFVLLDKKSYLLTYTHDPLANYKISEFFYIVIFIIVLLAVDHFFYTDLVLYG